MREVIGGCGNQLALKKGSYRLQIEREIREGGNGGAGYRQLRLVPGPKNDQKHKWEIIPRKRDTRCAEGPGASKHPRKYVSPSTAALQ